MYSLIAHCKEQLIGKEAFFASPCTYANHRCSQLSCSFITWQIALEYNY